MKEKIYTIPITRALECDTECLLCEVEKNIAHDALEFYTGAAMMEPDVRIETNRLGFCAHHYEKMLEGENKLSVALMLQTRAQETLNLFDVQNTKKGLFSKKNRKGDIAESIGSAFSSCAVCERIKRHMGDCIGNFTYLLKTQPDFCERFFKSKGLCMKHFMECLPQCDDKIFEELLLFQKRCFERVAADNDRFILKFDYRNAQMEWGNAKDAPYRISKKLRGLSAEI